jgi:hypothetical protein
MIDWWHRLRIQGTEHPILLQPFRFKPGIESFQRGQEAFKQLLVGKLEILMSLLELIAHVDEMVTSVMIR